MDYRCHNIFLFFCRLSVLSKRIVTSFQGYVACRFYPLQDLNTGYLPKFTSVNPILLNSLKLASLLQPIFASYFWIPKLVLPNAKRDKTILDKNVQNKKY